MSSIRQYGLRPLVLLFILNAVDEFDRAVLTIALDDIRDDFGLSDFTVGAASARRDLPHRASCRCPSATSRTARTASDILAVGALIWGVRRTASRQRRVSFVQLFLTRALLGVGQGTIGPTHLSLLSDYYPQAVRGRVMNYWRSANAFGSIVGAIVGGAIVA